MQALKTFLKEILKNKLAVLGVGSELRGDDGIGPYLSERLSNFNSESFLSINGDLVPENFTRDLRKFQPDNIIIIDAAFMGKSAGDIEIIRINEVTGISFSSHSMPISVLGKYLSQEIGANVYILGIQPINIDFGSEISLEVIEAADKIFEMIKEEIV
ncbi:MAG: hydrogenase maturation peptidase HycI [Methanofastidiosum sp.]|jgi:hydrogenase 3 maturation protease|nr:hydrogenase maturation peptidase HycI [Methanofastidiosum sp.]